MGASDQTVTTETKIDPIQQAYLRGSTYGMDDPEGFAQQFAAELARKNENRAAARAGLPLVNPVETGFRNGGIASLPANGMRPQAMLNLGNRSNAYNAAMMARQRYQMGGKIQGPGTGTSDSIPARIYQNGQPVSEARLSDGEVVLSRKDLANMDPAGNADRAANMVGNAKNGSRGQAAAQMYQMAQKFRNGGGVR